MRISYRRLVIPALWLLVVLVAFYLPYTLDGVVLVQLQQVIYLAVAVMSLNVLSGLSGQISIGQSAYIGTAAYATALLVQSRGWSYWSALPVAIAAGFLVGALTGLPALRITGIRLALATLSIAIVFPSVPVKFTAETGGTAGFNVSAMRPPESWGISSVAYNYWVLLGGAVIVFVLVRNVMNSRIGRSLIAIRDQQVAAYTVGINVSLVKVLVFGISGAICGLVGWMFVITNQFVSPSDFTVLLSIYLLVAMAIGGAGTLVGPIFGALFLIYAPRAIGEIGASPLLTPVIYGAALIVILFFLPQGVGGFLQQLGRRVVGRPSSAGSAGPAGPPPDPAAARAGLNDSTAPADHPVGSESHTG